MNKITEEVKSGRVLIADGAWGTLLQKRGLKQGTCPELWCVEQRDAVLDIARQYVCLLYTSPSPRDRQKSRMPSSA